MSQEVYELATVEAKLGPALSPMSRRTYAAAFMLFARWCMTQRIKALPTTPAVLAAYISHLAKKNYSRNTLRFRLAAIGHVNRAFGHPQPNLHADFQQIWEGIRRSRPPRVKTPKPLELVDLKRVLSFLSDDLRGLRDRALFLLGFFGLLTNFEICHLKREDITFDEFMIIEVRGVRARTVFVGPGRHPATCPIHAMRDWLEIGSIKTGYVFCQIDLHQKVHRTLISSSGVTNVLRKRLHQAGFRADDYRWQSLRSGYYLAAYDSNIDMELVARHAGIKDVAGLEARHFGQKRLWVDDQRSIDVNADHNSFSRRRKFE